MPTVTPRSARQCRASRRQAGVTLVELMIALVLGAIVVLAATAMVVSSRSTFRTQDETTRLAEAGRFGLELSDRMIRLAGYTNFGDDTTPPASYADTVYAAWNVAPDSYAMNGPMVVGTNNSRPGGLAGINGSDSLTIRFFGTSVANTTTATNGGQADGGVVDCGGYPVPQPAWNIIPLDASAAYANSRGFNVLFVDNDADGEPSLKCLRQTYDAVTGNPNGLDTQTLIRGVESFQVLFAEAIPDLPPNDDLDLHPPASIVYKTGIGGPNAVGNWENVVAVRIALLLRSNTGALTDPQPTSTVYQLFGANYPWGSDTGVNFGLTTLSLPDRTRARRIVQTTVFVRNRLSTWPSLQQ